MKRVRQTACLGALLLLVVVLATHATAQHTGTGSSAPPPPPGDGRLTVRVIHEAEPAEAAGIAIALYALSPDGTPGFAGGETGADGVFTFTGISNDPGIVYLVGARFREIPFGERVTFAAGEKEALVEIEVTSPTEETAGVRVDELRVRIDWMGDRVVLRELLSLTNPGNRVIQLPSEDRGRAIVVRPLGPSASDFSAGPGSVGDGIALENGGVRFWGPLYPGDQRVEYLYSLPIPASGGSFKLPVELGAAAGRIVVVAGTDGVDIAGSKLIPSSDVQSDSGQPLKSWARAGLAAGELLEVAVTLPESRFDPSLISIPRGDVWVELDDTRLTATLDIQIEVDPGAPVAGTPDAPLLRVTLPTGATLQGVAPAAESLGLIPRDHGGFDVIGPIGPGTTSLGYSYHLPTRPEGIELDMRFPGSVETLNVLIADTGLALDSRRLHRRRPFRSGTRNYLHREAFNIGPDEVVDLELAPLRGTGLPGSASVGLTIAAAAAGAFFLFAPLRGAARREVADDSTKTRFRAERDAIYTAIRDLDHDFETAKLEEEDYTEMREGLRAQAIELLRAERDAASQQIPRSDAASAAEASAAAAASTRSGAEVAGAVQTGAFCPHCGRNVLVSWRFCSHCGGHLDPAQEASG